MSQDSEQTRERIVTAATRLFYNEGIRATSVDAIAEKAGITKKTLYYHFRSKDDLIAAYLQSRDQPTLELYARWFDETPGSAADKIRGLFSEFARAADTAKWKGCGFQRTAAELAGTPGHPALKAGASHKKRFETWLADALAGQGVKDPKTTARSIVVLLDGAAAVMLVHRDPAYVETAGAVAAALVEPSHAAAAAPGRQAAQRRS
jgi:AcrR family transcriptional regulator